MIAAVSSSLPTSSANGLVDTIRWGSWLLATAAIASVIVQSAKLAYGRHDGPATASYIPSLTLIAIAAATVAALI
jgi:hypothetical protein